MKETIIAGTTGTCFSELTDPRVVGRTDHKMIDMLTISMLAIICGADNWPEIEEYGKAKHEWLKGFLDLKNGIPTHHTFRRLFRALNSEELQNCF